jgi:hypothetical protein
MDQMMFRCGFWTCLFIVVGIVALPTLGLAQETAVPSLRAGSGAETVDLDGLLNEAAWRAAAVSDALTQVEPVEGGAPTLRTTVRVLAGPGALVIGITCDSPPDDIVSFSVRRDAPLGQEDHIRIVLGPFRDGRSGYVFSINSRGARYDAIIEAGGENENAQWDGIWEAATARDDTGWSAEVRIPIQTLSFNPAVREWHFNFERRIQRRLELNRWASAVRQYPLTMTTHSGLLTDLPAFELGRGLSVRPGFAAGGGVPAPSVSVEGEFKPSLDITQRLGANVTASFTANTDFAETEVDTRQTNLTRFPLFFPEKRTFFLEGADILHFGPGVQNDVVPYFSRRMGLVNGREVPIIAGGKVNGRVGSTTFAGVIVAADREPGVVEERTTTAVVRVKQNLWRESYVGFMGTAGDPLGRADSWLAGVDFTYFTSTFLGNKNFSASVWAVGTGREDLGNDRLALATKIDYPNEEWNIRFFYRRAGRDFDPSLGFVPRRAMQRVNPAISNRTLFARGPIQEMTMGLNPILTLDLHGQWESYESSITAINWRFRSGDRVQVTVIPTGDRPLQPFQVSSGVVIAPAEYTWVRRRAGFTTAQKRGLYGSLTGTWGPFYDGDLTEWNASVAWNPTPLFTFEFNGERHTGSLPGGAFTQHLVGTRLRINVSSNLSIASYAQYDTDSDAIGVNSRLSWTFLPVADLFVVYNHNVQSLLDRWRMDSNQLVVKLQYAWRM